MKGSRAQIKEVPLLLELLELPEYLHLMTFAPRPAVYSAGATKLGYRSCALARVFFFHAVLGRETSQEPCGEVGRLLSDRTLVGKMRFSFIFRFVGSWALSGLPG
jgi:hypothetical protein